MFRMTYVWAALALSLLFASPSPAADTAKGDAGVREAAALCTAPYATVKMSCRTRDDRLIAVCSRQDGAFHVVFAKAGKTNARLVLPKNPADKRAVRVGYMMYAGGGGSYGRFKDDHGREYVVYSGLGRGWEQAGMSEVSGEEHLTDHVCLPASKPYDIGFPVMNEKVGYPQDARQRFEVPVD